MRRPTLMLAIGLPHGGPGQDEDNLNREHDSDDGPTNTLELIYERLKHGDEVAARGNVDCPLPAGNDSSGHTWQSSWFETLV